MSCSQFAAAALTAGPHVSNSFQVDVCFHRPVRVARQAIVFSSDPSTGMLNLLARGIDTAGDADVLGSSYRTERPSPLSIVEDWRPVGSAALGCRESLE